MPELQVSGMAQVTGVGPCPLIESGYGRVVLGTFASVSTDVYELKLAGEDARIGVTGGHLIWSLDRGGWVCARALELGERLATAAGEAVVESVLPMAGRQAVYSLYVEADHRYLVGDLGVLVHNASPNPCTRVQGGTPAIQAAAKQLEVARAQLRLAMERHYGRQAMVNMEAHHGIPVELLNDPQVSRVIIRAVKGGFKFNGVDNGVIAPQGHGPHANYTA